MLYQIFFAQLIVFVYCYSDYESRPSLLNLRRRNVIPLHQYYRRWNKDDDFVYRKTMDIRPNVRQSNEKSEQNTPKSRRNNVKNKIDKLRNEINWLTMYGEEGISVGVPEGSMPGGLLVINGYTNSIEKELQENP